MNGVDASGWTRRRPRGGAARTTQSCPDSRPEATPPGDPRTWSFGVRVDVAHGRRADAFTLNYLDYAGEYAAALAGAEGEMNEAFIAALKDTDILMGVLDGDDLRRVLLG